MNRFKYIVFILVAVVCSLIIGYPYISNMGNDDEDMKDMANEITVNNGKYIVGEGIQQGVYDVEVVDGQIKFMQRELSTKDKLLGIKLSIGERVDIVGKGNVRLSPASSKAVNMNMLGEYQFHHSGFYKIGSQLPEGEFILSYIGTSEKEKPLIQILSSKRKVLKGYNFKGKKNYKIILKKDEVLEVNKYLFFEDDNLIVILKPQ